MNYMHLLNSGMMLSIFSYVAIALPAPATAADALAEALIAQSIAAYPGTCACPYSVNRAGRRCGARSAYSKPGGARPLCYPEDISDQDRRAFETAASRSLSRKRH